MVVSERRKFYILYANISLSSGCIAYAINTAYRRMITLRYMVYSEHHRQEILNGDLDSYLVRGDDHSISRFINLIVIQSSENVVSC
jgi:hypothetical protein